MYDQKAHKRIAATEEPSEKQCSDKHASFDATKFFLPLEAGVAEGIGDDAAT
jgi:hypothetical protein